MERDEHAEYEMTPEDLDRGREVGEALEKAAQKVGLYQQGVQVGTVTDPEGKLRLFIVSTFTANEFAFSDRVLNPEEANINDEFVALKTQLDEQSVDEYREMLRKRMEGESDDA